MKKSLAGLNQKAKLLVSQRKTVDFEYYPITGYEVTKRLPYSVRVLLESAVRNKDDFSVTQKDVDTILNWRSSSLEGSDIAYKPARVLLQDFTGVPLVADVAAMREAVKRLGGDPRKVNPLVPIDLVIDHSVQADVARSPDAVRRNEQIELERNRERFAFLKWGSKGLGNMRIVPPGSGIVHQVNLEYLSRVVFNADKGGILYPDSLVGTDSHSTMTCGVGILSWGVGGIEAESVLLGQPISMVIPQVVGVHLTGNLREGVTATDLVLSITELLRKKGVVGKFVEFFGPGVRSLSVPTRATIANMAPEYGATVGYFPYDEMTGEFLMQIGRSRDFVETAGTYLRVNGLSPTYAANEITPDYSDVVNLNLEDVVPCVAGPKRPQDRVPLTKLKSEFVQAITAPNGFKGFGAVSSQSPPGGQLKHGSVVLAAITSCTNTSNPGVMLAAGLIARKAREFGLKVPEYVKPVLAPGSKAVSAYLDKAGLLKDLEAVGFYTTGYGCMVCIGNTGELDPAVLGEIQDKKLVVASVLSGNRNFEGRIHPSTKANYLASPPLVVAFALAGRVDIDFATEPLAKSPVTGKDIYLADLWPSQQLIDNTSRTAVQPEIFNNVYSNISAGNAAWDSIETSEGELYEWDLKSTYIRRPPYFDNATLDPAQVADIVKARCLLNLGDSITTDHISPAGSVAKDSPAARYLLDNGVAQKDWNVYGTLRGNHEIMARGTFAHVKLINKMSARAGPLTIHVPTGVEGSVYDVAMKYMLEGKDSVILAGKEYGTGSSRDWAAKGVMLQGVRAVIAESFERIHRSNLVGMGVLPLQFQAGDSADSLGLTGHEEFTISGVANIKPGSIVEVVAHRQDGTPLIFKALARIDTDVEREYFSHGGVLLYVMRQLARG
jgi:aconitate hydratase